MISMVVPVYNMEKYILECLDSIKNQIFKDYEIIVVDDGSTDLSVDVIKKFSYSNNNIKIKIISQENSGVSAARNRGLKEASGEYVCFIDSDDVLAPQYLFEMHNVSIETKLDLVFCSVKSFNDNQKIIKYKYINKKYLVDNSINMLRKFLYFKFNAQAGSFLVKRKVLIDNNLKFEEGFKYGEDKYLIYKMIHHAPSVAICNGFLYFYRIRPGSAISTMDSRRIEAINLLHSLESYFEENNPDFAIEFKTYAAARSVWTNLWQIAASSKNFDKFMNDSLIYKPSIYIVKLISYPQKMVSVSSRIYLLSPRFYYFIAKIVTYFIKRKKCWS